MQMQSSVYLLLLSKEVEMWAHAHLGGILMESQVASLDKSWLNDR